MDKTKAADLTKDEIVKVLETSLDGLTEAEASNRLRSYGLNSLKRDNRRSIVDIFIKQFKSSLVYLLIVASVLSFALHDANDGIVIVVILLINTGLGFYQEFKSENAVEKLQKLVGKDVLAIRQGQQVLIAEKLLVPGDLVILREGDIVPADIRLLSVEDLSVNESELTGESVAVTKTTKGPAALTYAGSVIESGEGKGIVYATANATEIGKIAHLSSATKRVTQFEKSLVTFSSFLVKVTFLTLLAVFVFKIILTHDTSHLGTLALFIIALSIAVVPEAMPVIVTVTLSRGALNLAKRHVIAKTLTAVEDLGNINILCSDKTGTLTENKQTIQKLIAEDDQLFQKLAIAALETSDIKHQKPLSSFDQAFIDYVPDDIKNEVASFKRLEELPFDPLARRRRVVYSDGDKCYLVEVGSVETLLALSHSTKQEEYLKIVSQDGKMGLRHLAIAYKEVNYKPDFNILSHEEGLNFVGFVALEDPLRPSAKHTVELAEKLGVSIKILSGDSREVTHYVASEVGLIKKKQRVYEGDELDELSDEKLSLIVKNNNVFARLNPEQKYRIIKLLKQQGNVVGYQGDGINDAPALKLADVAIAVSNATDVAQESADILLLRSDISVIVNGVKYGREIFSNINKYIRFTFVSNWGNFFALSALYLMSVSGLPILPVQVLLTSLLTDLPCITIATDNVDTDELQRPSKFNVHSLMFISLFLGSLTAIFEIIYFAIIKSRAPEVASTGLYLFLTFSALIVIFSIRSKGHFWKAPKLSRPMKIAFISVFLAALVLVYLPSTKHLLSFGSVSIGLLLITLFMTLVYFVVMDTIKVWFYRTNMAVHTENYN